MNGFGILTLREDDDFDGDLDDIFDLDDDLVIDLDEDDSLFDGPTLDFRFISNCAFGKRERMIDKLENKGGLVLVPNDTSYMELSTRSTYRIYTDDKATALKLIKFLKRKKIVREGSIRMVK